MMEQPLKRCRCAEQGHVYFLPHDGYRHVDAFDTRENVGHQIAPLVGFGISPIRDLIVGPAVDVMEDGPRQSPPCHQAEIRDVVASIDTHCPPDQFEHVSHGGKHRLIRGYTPVALGLR
jgi:hypothetical protein